jgi:FtsP/CotA-like multicopper oxidase with cupredoxin domain
MTARRQEETMETLRNGMTRRGLLRAGGLGAMTVAASGGLFAAVRGVAAAANPQVGLALAATDGHIILPNRPGGSPLYIFGFIPVDPGASVASLTSGYKGKAQTPAPVLALRQNTDIKLTLTNLGLVVRPDLADSHTVHWHGFRTPPALTDGVPEVSVAVPLNRQFTYFYRPHDAGTYMYHCHFEDVEHVQMGMTGIVFVRPALGDRFAYNHASTAFDREFPILLNEIWSLPHDHGEQIQESIWTDYDPDYWTLNGRVYPQTLLPNDSSSLPDELRILTGDRVACQPISSLIQCNGNDTVLLRLANLGYQQHAMQLPGIPMKVIGEDATLLRSPVGADLSYRTNTLYMGPGEARDVLFNAPVFSTLRPGGTDTVGAYNTYYFKNRDAVKLSNAGAAGLGGMATEVRVYAISLPAQTTPGETYV